MYYLILPHSSLFNHIPVLKTFRYILLTSLITIGLFSVAVLTGCKDKCGTTTCQNGGTCQDNKCSCPTGYSGNSCETGWSDPAIGTYTCTRADCNPVVLGVNTWQSSVTKNSSNGGFTININNFDNSGSTVVGTIDTFHNITVSPAAGSYGVNASGSYVDGKIKLTFATASSNGGIAYTCKMEMTKLQ